MKILYHFNQFSQGCDLWCTGQNFCHSQVEVDKGQGQISAIGKVQPSMPGHTSVQEFVVRCTHEGPWSYMCLKEEILTKKGCAQCQGRYRCWRAGAGKRPCCPNTLYSAGCFWQHHDNSRLENMWAWFKQCALAVIFDNLHPFLT